MTTNEIAHLVEAYGGGSTVYELATQFAVHRSTVSAILERKGVSRRYRILDGDGLDQAADLYAAGKSLAQVGEVLGVSRSTVALALKRAGIGLRPRPGWS